MKERKERKGKKNKKRSKTKKNIKLKLGTDTDAGEREKNLELLKRKWEKINYLANHFDPFMGNSSPTIDLYLNQFKLQDQDLDPYTLTSEILRTQEVIRQEMMAKGLREKDL